MLPSAPQCAAPVPAADLESAESRPLNPSHLLRLSTETLLFNHARAGVLYTRRLTLTNPLPTPMEVTIKPGNPERYTTEPASLTIGARDTEAVEVRLKMTTLPVPRRPGGAGAASAGGPVKDSFTIRSNFGVQRFFAMLTPAAARPSVGDSAAPAEPAAATAASSAGGAIEAQAAAAAAAAAEWSAETSAEWSAERAHLPAPVGLPAGQDAWPWPAQSSLEATLPGAPLAGVVPGAAAAAIAPTDVFEQLAQLDESNQALQREVAITAAELAHSRAEAERLSVQQHAMVDEQAAPDLRRLIQCMRQEDESKSARVLAVLHAKDAEIAQLLGVVEMLQAAAAEQHLQLQQRDERGALEVVAEVARREQGEASQGEVSRALHAAQQRIRELTAQVWASDGLGWPLIAADCRSDCL